MTSEINEITPSSEEVVNEVVKPVQDTKWYVIRVISGKERKIKEYIDKETKLNNWTNSVVQVLSPIEKDSTK